MTTTKGAANKPKVYAVTGQKRKRSDTPDDRTVGSTAFSAAGVIAPPISIENLCQIYDNSSSLSVCVEAVVVNTASHGYRIVQTDNEVPIDPKEEKILQSVISNLSYDQSLTAAMIKVQQERHRIGYAFIEVHRDAAGKFIHGRHRRSRYIRATATGKPVKIRRRLRRGGEDVYVEMAKGFRKWVQEINGNKTYFKEFGDPRRMSASEGYYDGENGRRVRKVDEATELVHFRIHSDDVYGTPRWVHMMPEILGVREAEELNYRYFQDNAIPAAVLLVSGGQLTNESYADLRNVLNGEGLGSERQNKIVVIECIPDREAIEEGGNVSVDLKPLTTARPDDALFTEYDRQSRNKIRSVWRLPGTSIGESQDTTFATANVSQAVAESQVYLPERHYLDEVLNMSLINSDLGLDLKTCKLESLAPSISSPESLIKSMTALGVLGAITPRQAIDLAQRELRIPVKQYPKKDEEGWEEWMDTPTHVLMKLNKEPMESDDEANSKDKGTKAVEDTGDLNIQPEHGNE